MKKLLIFLPLILFILLDLLGGFFGWFGQWHSGQNILLTEWFGFGHGTTGEGIYVTLPLFLMQKWLTGKVSYEYVDYYYYTIRTLAVLFIAFTTYLLYKYAFKTKPTQHDQKNIGKLEVMS
jgi:hypothetical protein